MELSHYMYIHSQVQDYFQSACLAYIKTMKDHLVKHKTQVIQPFKGPNKASCTARLSITEKIT